MKTKYYVIGGQYQYHCYNSPEIVNIMSLVDHGGEADEDTIKDYCRKHFNLKGWGEKE